MQLYIRTNLDTLVLPCNRSANLERQKRYKKVSINFALGQIGQIVSNCGHGSKGKLSRKVSFRNNLVIDGEGICSAYILVIFCEYHQISTYSYNL